MKLKQIRVDGYKNLIDCVVNLGDFNVIVGPNNSGKSNLLEAIQILWPICFGDQKVRKIIFDGTTPRFSIDYSICHLKEHQGKPLRIGMTFEATIHNKLWIVDYDVSVYCSQDEDNPDKGFISESLTAKELGTPGRATLYLERKQEGSRQVLRVKKHKKVKLAEHTIAKTNPSLQAIESIYPDFAELPDELRSFVHMIELIVFSSTFTLSPVNLRRDIDSEKPIKSPPIVSTFDISLALDKLKEKGEHYNLFREAMSDILDLEEVDFYAEDYIPPSEKGESKPKRIRYFRLKCKGSPPSCIEEYSDGTLVVAAILVAILSEEDRGPILCLEELENCLHPAAIEKLLSFLQGNADRWPVLITTHSSHLLNGVNPEDVNVAVVDETGATHFEKIKNNRELRDYLNKGLMNFGDLLVDNYKQFRE
ncbi:MAG: AAA family ATPase [Planctomycetes bacterium]|nr:AAA family ATPase [Planctomycetota bacterium]